MVDEIKDYLKQIEKTQCNYKGTNKIDHDYDDFNVFKTQYDFVCGGIDKNNNYYEKYSKNGKTITLHHNTITFSR